MNIHYHYLNFYYHLNFNSIKHLYYFFMKILIKTAYFSDYFKY